MTVFPNLMNFAGNDSKELKFICDVMLGRLARYLRMLGLDTAYSKAIAEKGLRRRSRDEQRIILTRRTVFLQQREPSEYIFIKSNNSQKQLFEICTRFSLKNDLIKPFTRCLACNTMLENTSRNTVEGRVPDFVFQEIKQFHVCPNCKKIFWPGTHHDNMTGFLKTLLSGQAHQSQ